MDDTISRQAAIDAVTDELDMIDHVPQWVFDRLEGRLKQLPPAQPEQRTGKWIPSDSQCGIRCSVCGVPVDDFCHSIDYIDLDYEPNFCPNCGLPMKGIKNADTKI